MHAICHHCFFKLPEICYVCRFRQSEQSTVQIDHLRAFAAEELETPVEVTLGHHSSFPLYGGAIGSQLNISLLLRKFLLFPIFLLGKFLFLISFPSPFSIVKMSF